MSGRMKRGAPGQPDERVKFFDGESLLPLIDNPGESNAV